MGSTNDKSNLESQQPFAQSELDERADEMSTKMQLSCMNAINSSYQMPISEHILYSSYESYDNIMLNARQLLDGAMTILAECSETQQAAGQQSSHSINRKLDFNNITNLRDKFDAVHDFSEQMFDKIGQNLDDADGWTSRDAQLVQATLKAASQNRLAQPTKSQPIRSSSKGPSSLSPTSSSNKSKLQSSDSKQNIRSTTQQQQQQHQQTDHLNASKRQQPKAPTTQVNSVVQSFSPLQAKGYFGKKHYNSTNQRYAMLENKNIPRPQNKFKDTIDNTCGPFEPLIKTKPNAKVPLELIMERDDYGTEYYSHPYEYEINDFRPDEELMQIRDPIEPPDLNSTPITLVESMEQLNEMCSHIEKQKELAVDVEHHSYRSFQGITCLIQISSRTRDFVIDAIKLRGNLSRLNQSFTNPNIVKVFHGADCDILWLQRDFGVYVVNLFDTSRASKLMKFAHLSLAFLMKHYCNVESDKSYQLADWRERPLPVPMLQYARADTHYLLYIYDRLRNDILMKGSSGRNLLETVYERGKEICLKRYEKPPFSDKSHLTALRKSRSTFNARQMFAFKELYAWRDSISRELDESVGYVLPNNLMIRIAEYLPREPQGITALCNPVPPTVKKFLSDIHSIILKAIDIPLDETSKIISNNMNINPSLRSIDLDTLNYKQDIAHSAGLHELSVPNLLDKMYSLNCSSDDTVVSNRQDNRNSPRSNRGRHNNKPSSRLYNFLDSSWTKDSHNRSKASM